MPVPDITNTVSGHSSVSCQPLVRLLTITRVKGRYRLLASRPVNVSVTDCACKKAAVRQHNNIVVKNLFILLNIIIWLQKYEKVEENGDAIK
jgi:hypothetical protein